MLGPPCLHHQPLSWLPWCCPWWGSTPSSVPIAPSGARSRGARCRCPRAVTQGGSSGALCAPSRGPVAPTLRFPFLESLDQGKKCIFGEFHLLQLQSLFFFSPPFYFKWAKAPFVLPQLSGQAASELLPADSALGSRLAQPFPSGSASLLRWQVPMVAATAGTVAPVPLLPGGALQLLPCF